MIINNNYHGPVANDMHGGTINKVSQHNRGATPQEIADAVGALLAVLGENKEREKDAQTAISELTEAEEDLRNNRLPFGKLAKVLEFFSKAEYVALRAPEVASRLADLARVLGLG
jgi:hypothetical protein